MSAGCVRGLANMFTRTIFDLIFDLTEGQALKVNLKSSPHQRGQCVVLPTFHGEKRGKSEHG